jgi:hypothetical protein
MKATYAASGFNANVESPIWYAPGSERRSEMRRTILANTCRTSHALLMALILWAPSAAAQMAIENA